MPNDPLSPHVLVANRSFMRRVARELCGESLADDAVQAASVHALRAAPRSGGAVRSWLRSVTRNAALDLVRSEQRRRRRESLAAPPLEARGGPAASEAQLHLVAQSLAALREPYRTTLRLRFYDGLSYRAIARREGVGVEAVRSRVKRGLAELRRRLDERFGGEGAWLPVLLGWPGVSLRGRPGAVRPRLAAAALGAAVLPLALAVLPWTGRGGGEAPVQVAAPAADAAAPPRESLELPPADAIAGGTRRLLGRAGRALGTCRFADGSPAAGATVLALPPGARVLHADLRAQALATATADALGRFAIEAHPGRFALWAMLGEEAVARELARVDAAAGDPVEGIELHLEPARVIEGRVVDPRGLPVAGARVESTAASQLSRRLAFQDLGHPEARDRRRDAALSYGAHFGFRAASDAEGRFRLLAPAGRSLELWTEHADHLPRADVLPPGGGPAPGTVQIRLGGEAAMEFTVLPALPGARVEVFPLDGTEPRVTVCDGSGRARLDGWVPGRRFVARVRHPGFATHVTSVTAFGGDRRWTFSLRRLRSGAGIALDPGGRPVADAAVSVLQPGIAGELRAWGASGELCRELAVVQRTRTDARGEFELALGAHRDRVVLVEGRGLEGSQWLVPGAREVRVPCRPAPSPLELSARVVDAANGSPLGAFEAAVLVLDGGLPRPGPERSFADGSGLLDWRVEEGPAVALELRAPGYVPALLPLYGRAAAGALSLGPVALAPSRSAVLEVVDASGAPVSRGAVRFRAADGEPLLVPLGGGLRASRVYLDALGRAAVSELPAATVRIDVFTPLFADPARFTADLRVEPDGPLRLQVPRDLSGPREVVTLALEELPRSVADVRIRAFDRGGRQVLFHVLHATRGRLGQGAYFRSSYRRRLTGGLPESRVVESVHGPGSADAVVAGLDARGRWQLELPLPAGEPVELEVSGPGGTVRLDVDPAAAHAAYAVAVAPLSAPPGSRAGAGARPARRDPALHSEPTEPSPPGPARP